MEAKDIMQSAMAALYTNIRSGKYKVHDDARMSTYFLQICKYQWFDHLKSAHHRYTSSITEKDYNLRSEDVMYQLMEQEEQRKLIERSINQLGKKCQQILYQFYWEDLSLQEIANRFSFTKESAKNAKYRCLKQLKSIINPPKT